MQSLWLLLAAICAFFTYTLILYSGTLANGSQVLFALGDHFLLVAVIIAIAALSLLTIFLFKNRKLQFRLTILAIVLTLGYLALQYFSIEQFKKDNAVVTGSYHVSAVLPILSIIFLIMAARGINKDEKLVKSLDRLR